MPSKRTAGSSRKTRTQPGERKARALSRVEGPFLTAGPHEAGLLYRLKEACCRVPIPLTLRFYTRDACGIRPGPAPAATVRWLTFGFCWTFCLHPAQSMVEERRGVVPCGRGWPREPPPSHAPRARRG